MISTPTPTWTALAMDIVICGFVSNGFREDYTQEPLVCKEEAVTGYHHESSRSVILDDSDQRPRWTGRDLAHMAHSKRTTRSKGTIDYAAHLLSLLTSISIEEATDAGYHSSLTAALFSILLFTVPAPCSVQLHLTLL